ncbi:MAG: PKD domain-containing protein [bacterium]|jgi:PKD repeat protein
MTKSLAAFAIAAALLAASLLVPSCSAGKHRNSAGDAGGHRSRDWRDSPETGIAIAEPKSVALESALDEIRGYETPDGADPAVFETLRSELIRRLEEIHGNGAAAPGGGARESGIAGGARESGIAGGTRESGIAGGGSRNSASGNRIVSRAPQGDAGRVTDLAYDPGTNTLSWSYVNLGDFDVSGEVGVSDITPIALHFGALTNDGIGDDALEAWIDGDGDGVVGISDITPIALRFLNEVWGYVVLTSSLEQGEYIQIGAPTPVSQQVLAQHKITLNLPMGQQGFVCVVPVASDNSEGDSSNIIQIPANLIRPNIMSIAPQSALAGNSVVFRAAISGTQPFIYSWSFGDAATPSASNLQQPTEQIGSEGEYDCLLTVSNPAGSDSRHFNLDVVANPYVPNIKSVSPLFGIEGDRATFSASVNGTEPMYYSWDFGGGAVPNHSSDFWPQIVFATAGEYDGIFKATNSSGEDEFHFTFTVYGPGAPPQILSVSPLSGYRATQVQFSADVVGSEPLAYNWTFGDYAVPSQSSEATPVVMLGEPGDYVGMLELTSPFGMASFPFSFAVSHVDWYHSWGSVLSEYALEVTSTSNDSECIVGDISVEDDPFRDILLATFDQYGNFYWATTYHTTFNDCAGGIAADNEGGVYVAGWTATSFEPEPHNDLLIQRYNEYGYILWSKLFLAGVESVARSVVVNEDGFVYVLGFISDAADKICIILNLDSSGQLIWARAYPGAVAYPSEIDQQNGYLYAGGYNWDAEAGQGDLEIMKIDMDGNFIWARRWETPSKEYGNDLAISDTGDIYLGGGTEYYSNGVQKPILLKFSDSGELKKAACFQELPYWTRGIVPTSDGVYISFWRASLAKMDIDENIIWAFGLSDIKDYMDGMVIAKAGHDELVLAGNCNSASLKFEARNPYISHPSGEVINLNVTSGNISGIFVDSDGIQTWREGVLDVGGGSRDFLVQRLDPDEL